MKYYFPNIHGKYNFQASRKLLLSYYIIPFLYFNMKLRDLLKAYGCELEMYYLDPGFYCHFSVLCPRGLKLTMSTPFSMP